MTEQEGAGHEGVGHEETEHEIAGRAVSRDGLLGGRVAFWQFRDGYRAAIDPVLLAAFADARARDRVVDLGCGAGAVGLCLLARVAGLHVTGIDSDPEMQALAQRNAEANGVADQFRFCLARVETLTPESKPESETTALRESCDLVVANPPFLVADHATASPDPGRNRAMVEGAATLVDWIAAAEYLLRPKGRFAMIHRADRLDELLAALSPGFGEIVIFPLWPKQGGAARRLLVRARKHVRAPVQLAAGLVLHDEDGDWTPQASALLQGGSLSV